MNITKKCTTETELQKLMMKLRNHNYNRYAHSVMVADMAIKILKKLDFPFTDDNYTEFRNAALLHDIGYTKEFVRTGYHPVDGFLALTELGWSGNITNVILHHTFAEYMSNLESDEAQYIYLKAEKTNTPWVETMIEVVTLADCHTDHRGNYVTFEGRLEGIRRRYPNHPSKVYTLENKIQEVNKLIEKYNFNIYAYLKQ